MNVPNIRTSLTPKSYHQLNASESKANSTKNKDNEKLIVTGRIGIFFIY